jgi:hypothetical protein
LFETHPTATHCNISETDWTLFLYVFVMKLSQQQNSVRSGVSYVNVCFRDQICLQCQGPDVP